MKNLYLPGVPDLHLRNYMMSQIIKDYMPKLFSHLKRIEMGTDYFTSKWVMTLYSNFLPLWMMPYVFDNLFLERWTSIYWIAIALLRHMEKEIITMDMDALSRHLREQVRVCEYDTFELLWDADSIHIDKDTINFVRDKFYVEQA